MIIENVSFRNNLGQRISGRIYRNDPTSPKGIIFCHGLFSTKDGIKIKWLAPHFVNAGFTVLTFDFSFVGESEGNISDLSILQEALDLKCAFNFFKSYDITDVHIVGSSVGGVVSLLFAASGHAELKSLTLIAAPVMLAELIKNIACIDDIESLADNGITTIENIQIKNKFIEEIKFIDTADAVSRVKCPSLIIHGKEDKVVDYSNAGYLEKNLKCEHKLITIDGGDHNLTRESNLNIIKENIISWIKKHS